MGTKCMISFETVLLIDKIKRPVLGASLDGVQEGLQAQDDVARRRTKEAKGATEEAAAERNTLHASLGGVQEGLRAERDVAQRRAKEADEAAEEAAAERAIAPTRNLR